VEAAGIEDQAQDCEKAVGEESAGEEKEDVSSES
jgi:hypothetical protein